MKKALKIFLLVFIFSFSISFNIDARTTFGEGIYRVDENLSSIDLVHGAKFTQDIGYADVVDNENLRYKQLVSVLETPTGEDIKVVTWALTSSFKWTMSTVPAIARDYEKNHPGYRVIAGVNGDFFDIDGGENLPYATEGAHVSDGDVYKKTSNTAVGITNDGSNDPLVGNSKVTFNDKMTLAIYNDANELIYEFAVDKVNQDVLENEIGLYYANWNNEKKIEPITSPVGYVIENAEYAIAYSQADFYGRGIITGLKSKELNSGEFSIVSKNDQVNSILKTGVKVRVQYDLSEDWENVESITGVRNTLIYDGVNIIDKDTARHPRTMIGRKADGTLMLVVADGRAPEVRDGLT
ncbi:MAG TPA: hypothetical protein DD724_06900, partial [Lactobacillus acetotolerans]|nr:hypothetical protein [Lactobacillus acetotolerans]